MPDVDTAGYSYTTPVRKLISIHRAPWMCCTAHAAVCIDVVYCLHLFKFPCYVNSRLFPVQSHIRHQIVCGQYFWFAHGAACHRVHQFSSSFVNFGKLLEFYERKCFCCSGLMNQVNSQTSSIRRNSLRKELDHVGRSRTANYHHTSSDRRFVISTETGGTRSPRIQHPPARST